MNLLAAFPLNHALGWTLVHFLWQGAVVALLLWCVLGAIGPHASRSRYAAACVALGLMVALPLLTFVRLAMEDHRVAALARQPVPFADIFVVAGRGAAAVPWTLRLSTALEHVLPGLLAAWCVGVACFLARLTFGLFAAHALRKSGRAAGDDLQRLFDRLRTRLAVSPAVRLLHSARVQVPTVIGWLRPVVLLPASCLTGLAPAQIEAILCHELAHIRRHDYLVSVLQSIVETLLFYHPAVWWVSRQVRRERECCCDDFAVRAGGDVLAYARALAVLEGHRAVSQQLALAANGGVLKMRIQRLLGRSAASGKTQFASIAVLALLAVSALAVAGRIAWADSKAAKAAAHADATQTADGLPGATTVSEPVAILHGIARAGEVEIKDSDLVAQRAAIDRQEGDYNTLLAQAEQQPQLSMDDKQRLLDAASRLTNSIEAWSDQLVQQMQRAAEFEANFNSPAFQQQMAAAHARVNSPEFKKQLAEAQATAARMNSEDFRKQLAEAQATMKRLDSDELRKRFADANAALTTMDLAQLQKQLAASRAALDKLSTPELRRQLEADTRALAQIDMPALRKQLEDAARAAEDAGRVAALQRMRPFAPQPQLEARNAAPGTAEAPASGDDTAVPQNPTGPVRVSAGVTQGLIVSQPPPVYPEIAKAAHVQGVVVLHAIIGKQGEVEQLHVVSGPPMLTQSAIDAVRQWTYRPYMLNGQPVEVETTINVNYTLGAPDLSCTYYDPQDQGHAGTCEADKTEEGHYSCRADDDKTLVQPQIGCEWKVKRLQDSQQSSLSPAEIHVPVPATVLRPAGGAVRKIGGAVTQPVVIKTAEPEYSEEARKAKFMGTVLVGCIVNEHGTPEDVHVVRGVGLGLNDKAIDAVKQYKFKPAMENGQPVPVGLNIEVNFQVF